LIVDTMVNDGTLTAEQLVMTAAGIFGAAA